MADNKVKKEVNAIEQCQKAVRLLGWKYPYFMLLHSKISYETSTAIDTMAMDADGVMWINEEFVRNHMTDRDTLGGVIAHELCHLALLHNDRRGSRENHQWNVACDMVINSALQQDGIKLPKEALQLPHEFSSHHPDDNSAEDLYDWLKKNPKFVPGKPGKGGPKPTAGCGVSDGKGDKNSAINGPSVKVNWGNVGVAARAMAQAIGKGSSAFASLLKPLPAKIDWKKIVKHGFDMAYASINKDEQTFAKRNRRSPPDGCQYPGWIGYDPSIAFICDVSGSMDRRWLEQMLGEIQKCMRTFTGAKVYLISHTDVVTWQSWVTNTTKVSEGLQFSGGTDPIPAYKALAKAGKFSTVIHFTDCGFAEPWPSIPHRAKLIIGRFGPDWGCKPPKYSKVIPCDPPENR